MRAEVHWDRETSSVLGLGDEGTDPFVPREKDVAFGPVCSRRVLPRLSGHVS